MKELRFFTEHPCVIIADMWRLSRFLSQTSTAFMISHLSDYRTHSSHTAAPPAPWAYIFLLVATTDLGFRLQPNRKLGTVLRNTSISEYVFNHSTNTSPLRLYLSFFKPNLSTDSSPTMQTFSQLRKTIFMETIPLNTTDKQLVAREQPRVHFWHHSLQNMC